MSNKTQVILLWLLFLILGIDEPDKNYHICACIFWAAYYVRCEIENNKKNET